MIFVTLGTQDKPFMRLLNILEKAKKEKLIKEDIIVQAGYTKFKSEYFTTFDYVSQTEFEQYIKKCNILITHGGVGSILTGLKYNKKIMAIPKLSKYNEQHNDHQLDIISSFTKKKYILSFTNYHEFKEQYLNINSFQPSKYKSNNKQFCENLINYIKNN